MSVRIASLVAGVLRSSVANDRPERVDSRKPRSFMSSSRLIVSAPAEDLVAVGDDPLELLLPSARL